MIKTSGTQARRMSRNPADGIRWTAHWLNVKCGIGMGTAQEKVRVA